MLEFPGERVNLRKSAVFCENMLFSVKSLSSVPLSAPSDSWSRLSSSDTYFKAWPLFVMAAKTTSHAQQHHVRLVSIIQRCSSPRPSVKCRFRRLSAGFYLFIFFILSAGLGGLSAGFGDLSAGLLEKDVKQKTKIKIPRRASPSCALNNTRGLFLLEKNL